ncbi:DUF3168 domain-containing protein [Govanella unica]|uniref:DUF3168 domain-containing protein n=1 Tax=Govanella unica TaxID=2975056 RepID=A0A9X3U1X9_9PROT|nr:DUF3168 domain-containing protein [Govania unica]MDA5194949.1 DUF3168 domain-containing protein [Govania unica]
MSAARAVMAAVHGALQAAGLLIYDHVPEAAGLPYVTFGPLMERPWEGQGLAGCDLRLTLDFWSDATGRHDVLGAMELARGALFSGALTAAGYRLVLVAEELSQVLRETETRIFHGVMRLRLLMHDSSI